MSISGLSPLEIHSVAPDVCHSSMWEKESGGCSAGASKCVVDKYKCAHCKTISFAMVICSWVNFDGMTRSQLDRGTNTNQCDDHMIFVSRIFLINTPCLLQHGWHYHRHQQIHCYSPISLVKWNSIGRRTRKMSSSISQNEQLFSWFSSDGFGRQSKHCDLTWSSSLCISDLHLKLTFSLD